MQWPNLLESQIRGTRSLWSFLRVDEWQKWPIGPKMVSVKMSKNAKSSGLHSDVLKKLVFRDKK